MASQIKLPDFNENHITAFSTDKASHTHSLKPHQEPDTQNRHSPCEDNPVISRPPFNLISRCTHAYDYNEENTYMCLANARKLKPPITQREDVPIITSALPHL